MKNPIATLRETAAGFKHIGSIASTQKKLIEIVDALEDTEDATLETRKLLLEAYEALNDEVKVTKALKAENEKLRGELKKAQETKKKLD